MNRANLPYMKRIINNQVFLEETENFYHDDTRKNQYAIDAAH